MFDRVSVSRSVKPYGEKNRPPDWFSQKVSSYMSCDARKLVYGASNQVGHKLAYTLIEEC